MIVLVGFMGAGKSTVGPLLATAIGVGFVDVDRTIETAEGMSIAEVFTRYGEAAFRQMETTAVDKALSGPDAVVALGGGALGDPATCVALEWHTVVHLEVSYAEAMRRIGKDPGRPMLEVTDPRALFDARGDTYGRVARHTVATDGLTPGEVTTKIMAVTGDGADTDARGIRVALGDRSYDIHVGSGISSDVARLFDRDDAAQAFVLTHPGLTDAAKSVADSLAAEMEVSVLTAPEGEASKDLAIAGKLLEELASKHATRSDVLVSFGGGVIGDLAGFVASTYHRGMRIVHVPTTLLAQVDAAIGGKTGVNLASGKNLVGTIHQPVAVVCDVGLLRTLPDDELKAGMAEVIKYALIADPALTGHLSEQMEAILERDEVLLADIVRRCAAIKAGIVSADERETGGREVLNYGHTFGHALEHTTSMKHGDAVAVGMMAAAYLARGLGMLADADVELHRTLIEKAGLPITARADMDRVVEALHHDKKHRGELRFVLLQGIGRPVRGVNADLTQVREALRGVSG